MGHHTVTIRDISKAAGFSTCTVSKALRGDPKISRTTRDTILKTAESLGYQPDPELKKYMSYMSRRRNQSIRSTLGLLTPYSSKTDSQRFDYYVAFEKTILTRAESHGYRVDVLYMKDPNMRPERLKQIIHARNLDGLIVSPTGNTEETLPVAVGNLPTVSCLHTYRNPKMHRVEPDYYRNAMTALRTIFEKGYRNPFLVFTGGFHHVTDGMAEAAFHHFGALDLNKRMPPAYITKSYDYGKLPSLLKKHKADCVIGNSTFTLDWLYKTGYSLEDMGYASLNLVPKADKKQLNAPYDMSEISGMDVQADVIDSAVVDILVGMALRNESGTIENPQIVTIQGKWHDGITLPRK